MCVFNKNSVKYLKIDYSVHTLLTFLSVLVVRLIISAKLEYVLSNICPAEHKSNFEHTLKFMHSAILSLNW